MKLYNGDCLEVMKSIPDQSVDMVLCDLPYGITSFEWDQVLDWQKLWAEYKRIVKYGGVIALFAQEPFASEMRTTNKHQWKYDWIWEKPNGTNFLHARRAPLRNHEIICIFGNVSRHPETDVTEYHELDNIRAYLESERAACGLKNREINELLGNFMCGHYFTKGKQWYLIPERDYVKLQEATGCFPKPWEQLKKEYDEADVHFVFSSNEIPYNPQMVPGTPYKSKLSKPGYMTGGKRADATEVVTNDGWRYPKSVIKFPTTPTKIRIHPSQKPIELLEFLIKTYTSEGETVLDNTMGSGATGIACLNTNREFIGIEMDPDYFKAAKEWLERHESEKRQVSTPVVQSD